MCLVCVLCLCVCVNAANTWATNEPVPDLHAGGFQRPHQGFHRPRAAQGSVLKRVIILCFSRVVFLTCVACLTQPTTGVVGVNCQVSTLPSHVRLMAPGGELFDRIVSRGRYTERDASQLLYKLAKALAQCHQEGILHRKSTFSVVNSEMVK